MHIRVLFRLDSAPRELLFISRRAQAFKELAEVIACSGVTYNDHENVWLVGPVGDS